MKIYKYLMLLWVLMFASAAGATTLLTEGFDNISTLPGSGWFSVNNSAPLGDSDWFQGNDAIFTAFQGADNSYIAANFLNTAAGGNISNWGMTPVLALDGSIQLSFYTRTESGSPFADSLEVRLSTNGASTNVGSTDSSVGDFGILLGTINPGLFVGGYPESWTLIQFDISGLSAGTTGRFAFHYFVSDTNTNGDYIGLDSVSVTQQQPVPEPATLALLGSGIAILAISRKRFRS
jgi:hypothetical protein